MAGTYREERSIQVRGSVHHMWSHMWAQVLEYGRSIRKRYQWQCSSASAQQTPYFFTLLDLVVVAVGAGLSSSGTEGHSSPGSGVLMVNSVMDTQSGSQGYEST